MCVMRMFLRSRRGRHRGLGLALAPVYSVVTRAGEPVDPCAHAAHWEWHIEVGFVVCLQLEWSEELDGFHACHMSRTTWNPWHSWAVGEVNKDEVAAGSEPRVELGPVVADLGVGQVVEAAGVEHEIKGLVWRVFEDVGFVELDVDVGLVSSFFRGGEGGGNEVDADDSEALLREVCRVLAFAAAEVEGTPLLCALRDRGLK